MHLNNPGKSPPPLLCAAEATGPKPPCSLGLGHGKWVQRHQQLTVWHRDHQLLRGEDRLTARGHSRDLAPGVDKEG